MQAMRFEGIIKSWNDDRGFGFIEPLQGGQNIFVHIKAFNGLQGRPQPAQHVTFQVEIGPQGNKRAFDVELARLPRKAASRTRKEGSAQWGTASLFALPAFLVVLVAGYVFGHPPRWALWGYLAASALTFAVYAFDKSAARQGTRRTPESTLHWLALVGGWPGALVAQQVLRHKSSKAGFRSVFWATVVLNVVAFVALASSSVGQWLASLQ